VGKIPERCLRGAATSCSVFFLRERMGRTHERKHHRGRGSRVNKSWPRWGRISRECAAGSRDLFGQEDGCQNGFFRLQPGRKMINVSGGRSRRGPALTICANWLARRGRKILDYGEGHFRRVRQGEAGHGDGTVILAPDEKNTFVERSSPASRSPVCIICMFLAGPMSPRRGGPHAS